MNRRHAAFRACIALTALSIGGSAFAQLPPLTSIDVLDLPTVMPAVPPGGYPQTVAPTAAAPYLAPPAWSQTLAPNLRFVILSNFGSDAVLDRETGLVWIRRTVNPDAPGFFAVEACRRLTIGNRMGWRLPTVAEPQSLVDTSLPTSQSQPRLPVGHPFVVSPAGFPGTFGYWASETLKASGSTFRELVHLSSGSGQFSDAFDTQLTKGVLCVRGAHGAQPFRTDRD